MAGLVLNLLISRINYEMRMAIDRLQVEESGRDVASDQGKVAGWKELISNLSAAFHLEQLFLEDNGEEPVKLPDLEDNQVLMYQEDAEAIKVSEEWKAVTDRIQANIELLKCHLLFSAEKTRDLDIDQGKYRAQMIYQEVFESIEREVKRREDKEKQEAEEMPLFAGNEEEHEPKEELDLDDIAVDSGEEV